MTKLKSTKKRPTRRSKAKYAALQPELNLKTRYEEIDYDYVNQLSDKDKEWLNNFTEEYVNANMNHKGKKLHRSKKDKKLCYDRNNSRNRCILTRAKAGGKSVNLDDIIERKEKIGYEIESKLINEIDLNKFKKFKNTN